MYDSYLNKNNRHFFFHERKSETLQNTVLLPFHFLWAPWLRNASTVRHRGTYTVRRHQNI